MSGDLPRRVVIDASVLLKVFAPDAERHETHALALLERHDEGRTTFLATELLALEMVNIAARKWLLEETAVQQVVRAIEDLHIEWRRADLERVAHWTARGLSGYDAAYVALAEAERVPLVTDDDQIVAIAGSHVIALADIPV